MLLRASWTIRLYCTWSSILLKNHTNDFFSLEKLKDFESKKSSTQKCTSVKCFWTICVVYLVYSKFLKPYSFTVIYFARVACCCPWVRDSCCLYLIIVLLSLFLWKPIMTCIMKQSVYVTTDSSSPWDNCYPDEDILAFMFNNLSPAASVPSTAKVHMNTTVNVRDKCIIQQTIHQTCM